MLTWHLLLPQITDLIEELKKVRNSKILDGLRKVSGPITVKLNNLSASESNKIRLLFENSLNMWHQLTKVSVLSRCAVSACAVRCLVPGPTLPHLWTRSTASCQLTIGCPGPPVCDRRTTRSGRRAGSRATTRPPRCEPVNGARVVSVLL